MSRELILPASTIPVTVCNHRMGAVATFSHQTDSRFVSSIYAAELYGFRNNIRLGNYVNNTLGLNNEGIGRTEATGLMRHDIYFGTDKWANPDTGIIENIPDHYLSEWSAAGQKYFNAQIGDPKATRYPTCGKQMYDLTSGQLGFDTSAGTMGASSLKEFTDLVTYMQKLIIDNCGREASCGSYRNGVQGESSIMYGSFLGVRNSSYGDVIANKNADTRYGGNLGTKIDARSLRQFFISFPSSSRWWDYVDNIGATQQQADAYVIAQWIKCIVENGWYRDFCHWHSARDKNSLYKIDYFLNMIRTNASGSFFWSCSNGEALEYMFARELCNTVVACESNGNVFIIVDILDKFKGQFEQGFPLDTPVRQLNTPLSVEVDLSATSLAGKNVVSSFRKIRSLGNNKYVVEVPIFGREGLSSVKLMEGAGGVYNEALPQGEKVITGNKLTITTDQPTKCALFAVNSGGFDYDSSEYARSNTFSTIHEFDIQSGKDYRAGIINDFYQSALIE